MLFFVRFDVTQPANVSNEDLIAIWMREAEDSANQLGTVSGTNVSSAPSKVWKVRSEKTRVMWFTPWRRIARSGRTSRRTADA